MEVKMKLLIQCRYSFISFSHHHYLYSSLSSVDMFSTGPSGVIQE